MRRGGLFALVGAALVAGPARAHGDLHPRTPVMWDAGACMTIVDRSAEPVLALRYVIPYEDLFVPAEEVADSRRHQFLALCRDSSSMLEVLPNWLGAADVAAAAARGLVDPDAVGADELAPTSAWRGCLTRITGDDERRPISFAAAAEPVLWDTSSVAVGAYVVHGYTWEPPFNLWSRRPGVVKVVDDADPARAPPAIGLIDGEVITTVGAEAPIRGCVSAMPGATLTAAWTVAEPGRVDWTHFACDVPVSGDEFALAFAAPPAAESEVLTIRVEVRDPRGRRFTAFTSAPFVVLQGEPGGAGPTPACEPGGDEPGTDAATDGEGPDATGGEHPDATGEGSTTEADAGSSGAAPADPQLADDRGCTCASEAPARPWWLLFAWPLVRRRRAPRAAAACLPVIRGGQSRPARARGEAADPAPA